MEYINQKLIFTEDAILTTENDVVMHRWESDIMKHKADFICKNGGDILEVGFGMGLASNHIQSNNIASHTILELHPQILERAHEWVKDKPNTRIIEGNWIDTYKHVGDFDGILFDTFSDNLTTQFTQALQQYLMRDKCRVTWWNNLPSPATQFKFKDYEESQKPLIKAIEYDILHVTPTLNPYFNYKEYWMPKFINQNPQKCTTDTTQY